MPQGAEMSGAALPVSRVLPGHELRGGRAADPYELQRRGVLHAARAIRCQSF